MRKIGYVYPAINESYIKEQIQAINKYGVEKKIYDCKTVELNDGDELVIYELKSIGKTVIQLSTFFLDLDKRNIKWTILKKEESFCNISNEHFISIIFELANIESFVISERAIKGIKEAKLNGRVGGRRKTSNETIKKIKNLYYQQSYTLRQVSEECGVSLGTAYKYIKNNE